MNKREEYLSTKAFKYDLDKPINKGSHKREEYLSTKAFKYDLDKPINKGSLRDGHHVFHR
jgi:hypothetical protein